MPHVSDCKRLQGVMPGWAGIVTLVNAAVDFDLVDAFEQSARLKRHIQAGHAESV